MVRAGGWRMHYIHENPHKDRWTGMCVCIRKREGDNLLQSGVKVIVWKCVNGGLKVCAYVHVWAGGRGNGD